MPRETVRALVKVLAAATAIDSTRELTEALAILAPALSDYAQRGDDPAALWSIEQTGYDVHRAAAHIRRAIDRLAELDR